MVVMLVAIVIVAELVVAMEWVVVVMGKNTIPKKSKSASPSSSS